MNQRVQLQTYPLAREQLLPQLALAPAGSSGAYAPLEHDQPLLEKLQHAVAKLLEAVDSALSGDRASAEDCISRVGALLQGTTAPSDSTSEVIAASAATARLSAANTDSSAIADTRFEQAAPARSSAPIRGGLAPWQVRQVTTHIDTQLGCSITTDDLARIARLSPCHFSRAFRESFGDSPHKYVMRRRVERAQGLMLATSLSLGQIAVECGLADQAHLCKLFLKIVGESPGVWRRARCSPTER